MAKLPLPPANLAAIGIRPSELRAVSSGALWWRVYRTGPAPTTARNSLRYCGRGDARFEPHNLPKGTHPDRGVWYTASSPRTAVAEVFQRTRTVLRAGN